MNPPDTCEGGWHVSRAGNQMCDCGETTNPSYRTRWQRWRDRRRFRRIQKRR